MNNVIDFNNVKLQTKYEEFYDEMDSGTLRDVIMYSFHQRDFRSNNLDREKARLRALLNVMIKREGSNEYTDNLKRLHRRIEK